MGPKHLFFFLNKFNRWLWSTSGFEDHQPSLSSWLPRWCSNFQFFTFPVYFLHNKFIFLKYLLEHNTPFLKSLQWFPAFYRHTDSWISWLDLQGFPLSVIFCSLGLIHTFSFKRPHALATSLPFNPWYLCSVRALTSSLIALGVYWNFILQGPFQLVK